MMLNDATVQERVQAGVRWLDQHEPGWIRYINPTDLNMADGTACILGQLQESRYRKTMGFCGYLRDKRLTEHWAVLHGFTAPPLQGLFQDLGEWYEQLTSAWQATLQTF